MRVDRSEVVVGRRHDVKRLAVGLTWASSDAIGIVITLGSRTTHANATWNGVSPGDLSGSATQPGRPAAVAKLSRTGGDRRGCGPPSAIQPPGGQQRYPWAPWL